MRLFAFLCLALIRQRCIIAIDIDDIDLFNCTNDSPCEDSTLSAQNINDEPTEMSNDESTEIFTAEISKDINITTPIARTTQKPFSTTSMSFIGTTVRNDGEGKIGIVNKNHSNVCTCDIKISSCDINCCCDVDCNDFQLSVFSHCADRRSKMHDSRYCYTKNFIQRNNTRFIIERLASNLFCIAYDNLPPIYGMSDVPILRNRQVFDEAKCSVNRKKHTWNLHNSVIPSEFNFSSHYHDKTGVWKFHENFVKLMELPQSGLTGHCTFRKVVKYLETSKWRCMQTDLSNENSYLFTRMYNDFTVISSPRLFNSSYIKSENHSCPSNVCLSLTSLYCSESWTSCSSMKPALEQSSCSNGKCQNVVKKIRYAIYHNGTSGIRSIVLRIVHGNVTKKFYQHFEVIHEWTTEQRNEKLSRSGNPGYTIGRPMIIGKLESNVTGEKFMNINITRHHLTLPLRDKNGNCNSEKRYAIGFGENVRSSCSVELRTKNFSSSLACTSLQNETLRHMLLDAASHGDETRNDDEREIFVAKIGDFTTNDMTKWTKILLDEIPRNVISGQIFNNRIRCSALVTSIHIEILYTILPNHEEIESSYKIAGVAFTFTEPRDISWSRCIEKNCQDVLNVELMSYVTFTDISTPSMYYYAGGPNLDISLPYDFFYPFMSSGSETRYFSVISIVVPLIGIDLLHRIRI